jgi:hypothetical protein
VNNSRYKLFFLLFASLLFAEVASAQYKVQGTVYDSSRSYPLEAVSVLSTNGRGTITNAEGFYQIEVREKDSIWFSYLQKPTVKFPILKIADVTQFDIALHVPITVLKDLKIRPRNYKEDSIQNRIDYAKVFNFRRPNVESMTSMNATGAGIDINELIRLFQFRKNKSTLRFQQRLLQQERDKFIDNRFNKALIRQLTKLSGETLEKFMALYRPGYEFSLYSSDYDFQFYIKEAHKKFIGNRAL